FAVGPGPLARDEGTGHPARVARREAHDDEPRGAVAELPHAQARGPSPAPVTPPAAPFPEPAGHFVSLGLPRRAPSRLRNRAIMCAIHASRAPLWSASRERHLGNL